VKIMFLAKKIRSDVRSKDVNIYQHS